MTHDLTLPVANDDQENGDEVKTVASDSPGKTRL